jgi:hypothetical protein
MAATMEHQLSPLETFSARQVLWWTLEAAFRGSLHVIPEFIAMARRGAADNRELRLRQRLLAEAEASEAQLRGGDKSGERVLSRVAQAVRAEPRRSGG